MLYPENHSANTELRQQIRNAYRQDESEIVESLLAQDNVDAISRAKIWQKARGLILHIRKEQEGKGGVDALLQEFSLSTDEGIVLMCLAEALLRVPDKDTMDRLIRDKLSSGDWDSHLGNSDSLFVNASAWGLLLTGKMVTYSDDNNQRNFGVLKKTMGRVGEPVIRRAVRYAMQIMGTQFVLGTTILKALSRAAEEEAKGYRYSYDMLGEGARTDADAQRYFKSYMDAIEAIGKAAGSVGPEESPGISVKLSAIHPRYEFSHRQRVMDELVPRLKELALAAKRYDIGFTVDAEEADRLDLSFDVIEAVYMDDDLGDWEGFGLAIQAYQKRAHLVIDWVVELARKGGRQMMVRLVKGAYWDSEIKWSQEEGLEGYPVFTRKASTDVSYQVCAQKLLAARDCVFPQFATHNAYSVASILAMDSERKGYEFQRLHGMGEALYENMIADEGISCRIYAPVGEHADLLAYLVRRLLENGANSSFVNNIVDESIPVESLLEDPFATVESWEEKSNAVIPMPCDIFAQEFDQPRKNSAGLDLTDCNHTEPAKAALKGLVATWLESAAEESGDYAIVNPANHRETIGYLSFDSKEDIEQKLQLVEAGQIEWSAKAVSQRADLLTAMADALEKNRDEFLALCVKEAGKSIADAMAEIREAVDFCRYYARQAEVLYKAQDIEARGVVLCISPWNFPLAIFLGQVSAALVAGNTVLAKPAEQTSMVALRCIELWREIGLPKSALQLLVGPGKPIGEQLVPDSRIRAVMFTGSTGTGQWINQTLAAREDNSIPLLAETGGQNAIIVDSTALPEQVVDDVMTSGFQSAGQRCSALRVLFLQEDVADKIITMIKGAMAELHVGDPQWLSTDVGPVIDCAALERLQAHQQRLATLPNAQARLHYATAIPSDLPDGNYFAPHLYELQSLDLLSEEVFGPVVHIVRFKSNELDDVIAQINRAGFGLTLGVHSRIEAVCDKVARQAKVGNVYINRNIIGAVVGVQPFGGRGLSGTGPKAGGPAYLQSMVCTKEKSAAISLSLPAPDANSKADKTIAKVVKAQGIWESIGFDARLNQLRRLLANMANLESVPNLEAMLHNSQDSLHSMDEQFSAVKCLPGPTGESNLLGYEARGVLLVMKPVEQSFCHFFAPLVSALLAGNGLVVELQEGDKELFQHLLAFAKEVDMPANLICAADQQLVACALQSASLAGVVVPGFSVELQAILAKRDGAILPQIQANDRFFEQRLLVEKTVTTDTTAAGGNASLMSISED